MNYQEALAYMSKAKNIDNGRPTGQRGTRMLYDTHHATKMPVVSLRYHNSILVQWTHDHTLFTNDGWNTLTTKNRINEHLSPFHMYIVQRDFKWYLQRRDGHLGSITNEWALSHDFIITVTPEGEVDFL